MPSDDSTKELTIHGALEKVLAGEDLSRAEAEAVFSEMLLGGATDPQIAALMMGLTMKGFAKDEQAGITAAREKHLTARSDNLLTRSEERFLSDFEATSLMIAGGEDLSRKAAEFAMSEILSGRADPVAIAQFLAALRFKGETVDELVGFATAMRRHATPIFPAGHPRTDEALVDTAGTGGDARGTFNISTAAAFVIAGAGVRVAKHGNRAISSSCGSADVLEALGVAIDLAPERVGRAIEEVGIGFLFAPAVHAAMRHAMPVRRELKVRTVFNLLGPLTNPAGASAQIVGVYDAGLTELLARALGELGVRRAFVVHGADGLDEISISDETAIAELREGAVQSYTVVPEDFGLARAPLEAIRGGDARRNTHIIDRILGRHGGAHEHGPHRDIVLANSAAAIVAAGRAADFLEGVRVAAESIDSGAARAKLDALIEFSRSEKSRGQTAS
jgi:anthranilate phosphoribosyltransferase